MWGEAPATDNATKFGTGVDVQDVITHAKFYGDKKYVLWYAGICPIASKVGHVTLASGHTPIGVIHRPLCSRLLTMAYPTMKKNEESSFIR